MNYMKRTAQIAFAILPCFVASDSEAQLVAGVVPAGYSSTTYTIHLEPLVDFTEEMADFDVDCDGVNDFRLFLDRNNPSMDISNRLYLRSLVDSIRICADDMTALCPNYNHSLNYVEGQLMSCAVPFAMLNDTNVVVGDHVTFLCGGVAPEAADSVYIHYDKTTNGLVVEGWILMSFDIVSTNTIDPWAEVYAAIGVCGLNGIDQINADVMGFELYPNPSSDGRFKWSASNRVISIEIFDLLGQRIHASVGGTNGYVDLSGRRGTYVMRCGAEGGLLHVERLVID